MSQLEPLIADLALILMCAGVILSPRLRKRGERMTRTFMENLNGNSSE
ncbi:MAG: hypothetical protein IKH05_01040 [Bacteroidaceae bacterium]|nr:hypothetical protein [Bacteroidaceae bacterium]